MYAQLNDLSLQHFLLSHRPECIDIPNQGLTVNTGRQFPMFSLNL